MNKKKLSVVMAGAMLASSVAPVLAAEVQKSEVSANELGLLQKEIRELLNSKVFASDDTNAALRGKSVYAIYVNGKEQTKLDAGVSQDDLQKVFNGLNTGDKVEVYSKGFREVNGKYYSTELTGAVYEKYTADELVALAKEINEKVYDVNKKNQPGYDSLGYGPLSNLIRVDGAKFDTNTEKLVIEFVNDIGLVGANNNTITISVGDEKLDTTKYLDKDGVEQNIVSTTTPGMFYGFPKAAPKTAAGETDIKSSLVKEISITAGGYDLTVENLYDGLMLTTEGHDFFTAIKEAVAIGRTVTLKGNNTDVTTLTESNVKNAIKMIGGKARFSITFGAKGNLAAETYTITGTNEANAERLATWMIKPLARVDILAGDNRYETAVEIAKEYVGIKGIKNPTSATNKITDIVLVNGNALVDGLSAAPLAAKKDAPVLLTEADSLPKATKAYLKELMADHLVGADKSATIHLVGGESVLSKSLERELKSLGFSVERYGGDNREETSLEVAEAIGTTNEVFVVGAEGEADAMSIASVAANQKTPIVVAKKGGITEDAVYELKDKDVTIIGGVNAVSKSEYNEIKAEAKGVQRIAGVNRQATNAEIIKKYYKENFAGAIGNADHVIVAKDGQHNKMELVDALAAANFASEMNAPIVLATNKLSKEQENALELNAKNAYALYQVGHGVSRDVVKTIAENLGLTNR